MRAEFVQELAELAGADERILLLTADLGFSVVEPFADRFPDRFINVGVAEQNLIGVATGLAREGYVPFAYSIATFISMRPYEFIRNGPVLHQLPVRIVGAGGGLDYGHGGVTHYALEDVAILRAQPDLTVIVPADVRQACAALHASLTCPGPMYFRIARQSTPIPRLDEQLASSYTLGSLSLLGEAGADVLFLAMGPIAGEAIRAAEGLERRGVSAAVGIVSSFNPFPASSVAELALRSKIVISVEAHYRTGGLGTAVAEEIAERAIGTPLIRKGVPEMPRGYSGSPDYLLERYGINDQALQMEALAALTAFPVSKASPVQSAVSSER